MRRCVRLSERETEPFRISRMRFGCNSGPLARPNSDKEIFNA
jgi:hypothetical protein